MKFKAFSERTGSAAATRRMNEGASSARRRPGPNQSTLTNRPVKGHRIRLGPLQSHRAEAMASRQHHRQKTTTKTVPSRFPSSGVSPKPSQPPRANPSSRESPRRGHNDEEPSWASAAPRNRRSQTGDRSPFAKGYWDSLSEHIKLDAKEEEASFLMNERKSGKNENVCKRW